jgi:hypothetical protein
MLHQLRVDGSIWAYVAGSWSRVLAPGAAVQSICGGFPGHMHRLDLNGDIWELDYTPGGVWSPIDNNINTRHVSGGAGSLYQLHGDGSIWEYQVTGGWLEIDNNPDTRAIETTPGVLTAGTLHIYQLHGDGSVWEYFGPPITGWHPLDRNPATLAIAASQPDGLYQLRGDGTIWQYAGSPSAWLLIDTNPMTRTIAGGQNSASPVYKLHGDGSIWSYSPNPPVGWAQLDNNPRTVAIVVDTWAGKTDLYQLHGDGFIWVYTGPPFTGWKKIDSNPGTMLIASIPELVTV